MALQRFKFLRVAEYLGNRMHCRACTTRAVVDFVDFLACGVLK